MTEQQLRNLVQNIMERVANNDTQIAAIECADDLATLATAEWMYFKQGRDNLVSQLFKIALALGYETRRRHESYEPLDPGLWGSALDDDFSGED